VDETCDRRQTRLSGQGYRRGRQRQAPIKERLKYFYTGTKGMTTTRSPWQHLAGENNARVTLSVGEAKTENQMWKRDPEQARLFRVIRRARRFTPELMLGVVTEDDIERMEASRTAAPGGSMPWTSPKFRNLILMRQRPRIAGAAEACKTAAGR
jgi:hypothetical protein